jgi:ketosteroid isomerase-like protein
LSQENVNNYWRSIAAWNSGDLDGWLAIAATDPDSEFTRSREWAHVAKYDPDRPTITENYPSWKQALKAARLEE